MEKKKLLHLVIVFIVFSWLGFSSISAAALNDEVGYALNLIERNTKKHKQEINKLIDQSHIITRRSEDDVNNLRNGANGTEKHNMDLPQSTGEFSNQKSIVNPADINSELRKYLFVSFSMPESALMELIKQAKEHGFVPVLRGFKNEEYKPTFEALASILKETGYGVNIDPELFKEFAVDTVPSFVVAAPEKICPPNMSCRKSKFNKISGNITIAYALEKLVKEGEVYDE